MKLESIIERVIIVGFFSSLFTLMGYILATCLILILDGINITEEPTGVITIVILFLGSSYLINCFIEEGE